MIFGWTYARTYSDLMTNLGGPSRLIHSDLVMMMPALPLQPATANISPDSFRHRESRQREFH